MRVSVPIAVVATCLVLAACSGSNGNGTSSSGITLQNNGCSLTFSGSYTFTYTQQSGNCGAIQPVHETLNGMAMASSQSLSASCVNGSGTDVASPSSSGGCSLTGNFDGCQVPNSSTTFDLSEQVTWNASYTSATGTASISIMGTGACSGTYSMAVTQP